MGSSSTPSNLLPVAWQSPPEPAARERPAPHTHIPIAHLRAVYHLGDVEQRLGKLPERDSEALRGTYERMIERGPQRFQVKPSGVPALGHLYDELPNFGTVLDDVKRQCALCEDSRDGLEITPMLLVGPPGVGKTHFARQLAQLLGTGMGFVSMSSMTAGWILSGSSSQWKGAKPGKVFETLVDGQYANPLIVVDEIDKAGSEAAYDPLGALYTLLEHDTAARFIDEFAEVPIDASQVIWVATANDERAIPDPILNRMNVYEVPAPDLEAARRIATHLYTSLRAEHDWGRHFEPECTGDVLDRLAEMAPREMRRALATAFGNARLDKRDRLDVRDLPAPAGRRSTIGFMH